MDLGLKGKVALVTASSSGIGRAVAIRLAEEGAQVVVVGRNEAKLSDIESTSSSIHAMARDLTKPEAQSLVSDVISRFGKLDIVVLNTGGPTIQPFLHTTLEQWDAAFATLFRPVVAIAHAAASHMAERKGGAILFITSTWVKQPAAGSCLTASMRSALNSLCKLMSIELAPAGVRVNQVMPGATATARMETVLAGRAQKNGTTLAAELTKSHADIPMGRWAKPEETAQAIAFLVSDAAGYITGQTIAVDGGSLKSVF